MKKTALILALILAVSVPTFAKDKANWKHYNTSDNGYSYFYDVNSVKATGHLGFVSFDYKVYDPATNKNTKYTNKINCWTKDALIYGIKEKNDYSLTETLINNVCSVLDNDGLTLQTEYGRFKVNKNKYDKKMYYKEMPLSAIVYAKTNKDGTQTYDLYCSCAAAKLIKGGYSQFETLAFSNQLYYIFLNPDTMVQDLYDIKGNLIISDSTLEPVIRKLDNGTEKMYFIISGNSRGVEFASDVDERKVLTGKYMTIVRDNMTDIGRNFPIFMVKNAEFFGIAKIGEKKELVPVEYTSIKQKFNKTDKTPYFIVSKDGKLYGAYDYAGKLVLPLKYTKEQVETRIDNKNFK